MVHPGVLALFLSYSCDIFPNSSAWQIRKKKKMRIPSSGDIRGKNFEGTSNILSHLCFAISNLCLTGVWGQCTLMLKATYVGCNTIRGDEGLQK